MASRDDSTTRKALPPSPRPIPPRRGTIISPPLSEIDHPDVWIQHPDADNGGRLPPPSSFHGHTAIDTVVIDGKAIAEEIKKGIAGEVRRMKESIGKVPGLGIVMVGQRKDSLASLAIKMEACAQVGIACFFAGLSGDTMEDEILQTVRGFDENPSVHGVMLQLPLPKHVDKEKIGRAIKVDKDVDGFHPIHVGDLSLTGREPLFIPAAPKACVEVLLRSGAKIEGKRAVVVGRSKVTGLPTSLLLQRHHATVTSVNAFTERPERIASEADILVAAAGVPNMVRGDWIKRGAIVIDMGRMSGSDAGDDAGDVPQGDVCYEEAVGKASLIAAVPGGVGPVTAAMLLSNTLDSAKRFYNLI